MSQPPLLSVCIPTCNRAHRLRVVLESLLPQVRERRSEVEVWVSDNASTDTTAEVVAATSPDDAVRYSRNIRDLGPIANFVRCATELARGRYVWIIGDDDVLLPGAVDRVLAAIGESGGVAALYLNFRVATYPDQWPEAAVGGWDGPCERLANRDIGSRPLRRWADALSTESMLGTQVYAHVVEREIWVDYWRQRQAGELFSEPRWTWPHTYMLLDTVFDRPSYYVGDPILTIFDSGSSWHQRSLTVGLLRLPEYVEDLISRGQPAASLRPFLDRVIWSHLPLVEGVARSGPARGEPGLVRVLLHNWRRPAAWKVVALAAARAHPGRAWAGAVAALAARRARRRGGGA